MNEQTRLILEEYSPNDWKLTDPLNREMIIESIRNEEDHEAYEKLAEILYGSQYSFIKKLKNNKLDDSDVYDEYYQKFDVFQQTKMRLDAYMSFVNEMGVTVFPKIMYDDFKECLDFLHDHISNRDIPNDGRIAHHLINCFRDSREAFEKVESF